jgi:hypothetical protein
METSDARKRHEPEPPATIELDRDTLASVAKLLREVGEGIVADAQENAGVFNEIAEVIEARLAE